MNILFFGTDLFAKEILSFLLQKGVEILAVITRPDQPKGRSLELSPSPVKEWMQKEGVAIPILEPIKASDKAFIEQVRGLSPDLFLVVSYGQLIKQELLDLPKIGSINVHPSLLPKYRGASPMQSALLEGEKETGVTIMEMVLAMDAGDILHQVRIPIGENTTLGELEQELCEESKKALWHVLTHIFKTSRLPTKTAQNEGLATFTKKITPESSFIDWNQKASKIHNQIRAMNPRPGARTLLLQNGEKKTLKVWKSEVFPQNFSEKKGGEIAFYDKKMGWIVACGEGAIKLLEIQLEGKKRVTSLDYLNGFEKPIFIT